MTLDYTPPQMATYVQSLPQKYVGDLYATIKDPITRISIEYKVPIWGQIADGREHKDAVHLMLYNEFPFHGKGFIYVSWRNVPSSPELNDAAREGKVKDLKPYSGVAYD